MFCHQCEQTAKGVACTVKGVCGKDASTDFLQDFLIYLSAGLSEVSLKAEERGVVSKEVDRFLMNALFTTLTNVNFDPEYLQKYIEKTVELRERLIKEAQVEKDEFYNIFPEKDLENLIEQAQKYEITPEFFENENEDIVSLKFTILYALKGIGAYTYHAAKLGEESEELYRGFKKLLVAIYRDQKSYLQTWIERALEAGRLNYIAMELLDKANTGNFGHPVPTKVPLGHKAGKAILISGHDLKDLYLLLKQTEGKGIYIYTHGEMLPAHGYPELKKFPHFYGHYGTAWQNQQKEFVDFPGPIVMTTNCLMPPKDSYKDRVFTLGPVGYPGLKHISEKDFSPVIEMALNMEGFKDDESGKEVMVGFARNAILSVADKVIEGVKSGKIRHFFLVGGCDGAKASRKYYTEIVEKIPKDCLVLTLGCGKFRFFDKDLGDIEGIPRLLDLGQCNDAYSAIQVALALSKAFNVEVNELPLSLILSWYEQKAVAILLTLLYLGIKNIKIGPSLPAFLSKNVLNFLQKEYNLKPITTPEEDLKEILG